MNLAEYIKGFLGIIAIIFFGIGIVVWKFRAADEIQEIEKKIDVDTKKVIESDLKVLSDVSFPDEIDVRKMYGVISAGGIQEIECIKVYEDKYFVKMKFYGDGIYYRVYSDSGDNYLLYWNGSLAGYHYKAVSENYKNSRN